ncbi:MAG: cytochrome c [Pseudomonadota bacterium]
MIISPLRSLLATGSLLAMLVPLSLHAAEPEDIIKYRQNVMKAVGGHTSAAGAIVQGKVEYKSDLLEHARSLQALTRNIPALFQKDSDFGDTKARDEVWSKRADFEKRANDTKAKVEVFAKAVQSSNQQTIAASFKDVGESCKACHKDFRKEDK